MDLPEQPTIHLEGAEQSTIRLGRAEPSAMQLGQPAPVPQPLPTNDRSRNRLLTGCLSVLLVLSGILVGVVGALFYVSANAADRQAPATSPLPTNAAITLEISPTYLTQVLQKQVKLPGVPGEIKNIRAKIESDGTITVTGDDQLTLFLGVTTTRHVQLRLRPYVNACQLQMHVLHADLDGIPMPISPATFYAELETQINQQMQVSPSQLPQGFTYCMTGVRAVPEGLFVTYSATPTA
ncbi:MAG TPA: hypothetical protein VKR06_20415 [Ktedonosporobacter sp.]|nr:hypothetical protein [Ktedonosporobacter sp.]